MTHLTVPHLQNSTFNTAAKKKHNQFCQFSTIDNVFTQNNPLAIMGSPDLFHSSGILLLFELLLNYYPLCGKWMEQKEECRIRPSMLSAMHAYCLCSEKKVQTHEPSKPIIRIANGRI